jgi:hypothetical protein
MMKYPFNLQTINSSYQKIKNAESEKLSAFFILSYKSVSDFFQLHRVMLIFEYQGKYYGYN